MYALNTIDIILANENSAILYKKLNQNMLNMEKIIVSHSIVYVISGHVEIETYDYQKFTVSDGEMLFVARDSYLISDYIKDDKDMQVYLFFFDHAFTSEFLRTMNVIKEKNRQNIVQLKVSNNILNYLNSLENVAYENRENLQMLKIKIFEFLYLVCEANETFLSVLKAQETVKTDIETYMLEHYDKNLSVSDWATLSGFSLSTFNRKFKKLYDTSPKQWILQENMKLAYVALKEGSTVSQCASEFGYSNTSNFIKAFKNIYKKTPKQFSMT